MLDRLVCAGWSCANAAWSGAFLYAAFTLPWGVPVLLAALLAVFFGVAATFPLTANYGRIGRHA